MTRSKGNLKNLSLIKNVRALFHVKLHLSVKFHEVSVRVAEAGKSS